MLLFEWRIKLFKRGSVNNDIYLNNLFCFWGIVLCFIIKKILRNKVWRDYEFQVGILVIIVSYTRDLDFGKLFYFFGGENNIVFKGCIREI